jgi:predicted transcriptional regulator
MELSSHNLKSLLPHGSISAIAKELGISTAAVSQALKRGKPGSKVVQEAVRIAEANGALYTARALAGLTSK